MSINKKKTRYFYVNPPGSADPAQIKAFSDLHSLDVGQMWVPGMKAEPNVLYRFEGTEAEMSPEIQRYADHIVYVQTTS